MDCHLGRIRSRVPRTLGVLGSQIKSEPTDEGGMVAERSPNSLFVYDMIGLEEIIFGGKCVEPAA